MKKTMVVFLMALMVMPLFSIAIQGGPLCQYNSFDFDLSDKSGYKDVENYTFGFQLTERWSWFLIEQDVIFEGLSKETFDIESNIYIGLCSPLLFNHISFGVCGGVNLALERVYEGGPLKFTCGDVYVENVSNAVMNNISAACNMLPVKLFLDIHATQSLLARVEYLVNYKACRDFLINEMGISDMIRTGSLALCLKYSWRAER